MDTQTVEKCVYCGSDESLMRKDRLNPKQKMRATFAGVRFPACSRCHSKALCGLSYGKTSYSRLRIDLEDLRGRVDRTLSPDDIVGAHSMVKELNGLWERFTAEWTVIQLELDGMEKMPPRYMRIKLQVMQKRVRQMNDTQERLLRMAEALGKVVNLDYDGDKKIARATLRKDWFRNSIFQNAGFKCAECSGMERLSIDHIVPIIRNGVTEIHNLQVLCVPCNAKKGSRLIA